MREQFVTFEIALKLKELGFGEDCLAWYYLPANASNENDYILALDSETPENQIVYIKAPLWQQVIDWLREELNIHLYLPKSVYGGYVYVVDSKYSDTIYKDYYDAREQAILKAIELCKK